jgi:hypothetical protein
MKYKKEDNFYVIFLEKGEELVKTLTDFCKENNIKSGYIHGIGAASEVEIGAYSLTDKKYKLKKLKGQYEIISLFATISSELLHFHIALGDENLKMLAGHCKSALISIACEVILVPGKESIERKFDEETKLKLMNL